MRKLFFSIKPRKTWLPNAVECLGLGLVIAGLWVFSPIIAVIGTGFALILLAQGLNSGRSES